MKRPTEPNRRATSLPFEISEGIKSGQVLAGDDFTPAQLTTWFEQEREAFFHDDAGNSHVDPWYAYMRFVNEILGFSRTAADRGSMLALGPGPGKELEEFVGRHPLWEITFIEASANFKMELRQKFPKCRLVNPEITGDIGLGDGSQDVVCAFSVLHHIPNVSHVLKEIGRVTKSGGLLLVREPCSSMGDWRYSRSATPNERGISRALLASMARKAGFELVIKPVPILFQPLNRIAALASLPLGLMYLIDRCVSRIVSLNDHYWRDSWLKKAGPSAYFYVFHKK